MEIEEQAITISKALITVDRSLPVGTPVILTIEGEVYSDKNIPNHDGTGLIHVMVIKGAIADVKSSGKVISEQTEDEHL